MAKKEYDEDLFEFFSKLIDNPKEIDLLKNIMSGVDGDKIIEEYIKSQGDQKDD